MEIFWNRSYAVISPSISLRQRSAKAMKLTPTENEILLHRLAVPDALADTLTDCAEGESPALPDVSREYVEQVAAELHEAMQARAFIPSVLTPTERAILADCVEGSTFFGNIEDAVALGEVSKSKAARQVAAMESLAEKIGRLIGRQVKPALF